MLSHYLIDFVLPRMNISIDQYRAFELDTTHRKAIFLAMYAEFGNWRAGTRFVRAHRAEVRAWREDDEEFRLLMDDAWEEHIDGNELEAYRRAVRGVTEERKYSDSLLTMLLKSQRPKKYAEHSTISGPDGGPVKVDRVERVIVRPGDVVK